MPATPTPAQAAWQDLELGMFIHFAPNTWTDREGDDLSLPLGALDPARLDTDQWAHVARSMGARYIVFVAKHIGGFCWWQTESTTYSVSGIPWRGGKGDVMRDLARSCEAAGIRLGVYLSPRDEKHHAATGGVCEAPQAQARYDAIYRLQLEEILTRYGDIAEIWFDGSIGIEVGDILRRHAPETMVFQGPHATIRWVGNEDGHAPYPCWNTVSRDAAASGTSTSEHSDPDGDTWLPCEVDTVNVKPHTWFWNSSPARTLRSVEELIECYYRSVGHGAVLLLNQTPDTTGLIPEADAIRAGEFGSEIRRRFGRSIAEGSGDGEQLEYGLPQPALIDHAVTMEKLAFGERVRSYALEGRTEGQWRELCRGSAIGHKKIDRFEPALVDRVRLRVLEASDKPKIRRLALYHVGQDD